MKITVGSTNPAKVEAVREILRDYPHLKDAEVMGVDARSEVGDQPKTLEATVEGAMNRAKNAYDASDYSVGIESGFMKVPNTKSGYFDVCIAAIYDGAEYSLGLSSGFETPDRETMRLVIEEGFTLDVAANHTGLTSDPDIGKKDGVSGLLTRGHLTRKEFTKQALRTALIHIDQHA